MTAAEIVLRLVGAFYVFAGYFLTRIILTSRIAEQAIAALTGQRTARAENIKSVWSLTLAVVVFTSGLALALLLDLAVSLFLTATALQVFYLVWLAPWYIDPSGSDTDGRRQTLNALIVYGAATLGVLWGWQKGLLSSWSDASTVSRSVAAVGLAVFAIYIVQSLVKVAREPTPAAPPPDMPPVDPAKVRRLRVMAMLTDSPLWSLDDENSGPVTPESIGLSDDLTRAFSQWSAAYANLLQSENANGGPRNQDGHLRHLGDGRVLAERLAGERPDIEVYIEDAESSIDRVNPRT